MLNILTEFSEYRYKYTCEMVIVTLHLCTFSQHDRRYVVGALQTTKEKRLIKAEKLLADGRSELITRVVDAQ